MKNVVKSSLFGYFNTQETHSVTPGSYLCVVKFVQAPLLKTVLIRRLVYVLEISKSSTKLAVLQESLLYYVKVGVTTSLLKGPT